MFQRRRWFKGRPLHGKDVADIAWFRLDAQEMSEQDWREGFARSFAVFLNGDALRDLDENGRRLRDDSFLLLFNAHTDPVPFTMPPASFGVGWTVVVDTTTELGERGENLAASAVVGVAGRSLLVLSRPPRS